MRDPQNKSIFERQYKRYDAWYDKNRFAYLSQLKAIRTVLPQKVLRETSRVLKKNGKLILVRVALW